MGKTPEYTKNAIKTYQAGKDRVNLLLDLGTKDRIKSAYGEDVSITAYIKGLIAADLDRLEAKTTTDQPQEQAQDFSDVPFM